LNYFRDPPGLFAEMAKTGPVSDLDAFRNLDMSPPNSSPRDRASSRRSAPRASEEISPPQKENERPTLLSPKLSKSRAHQAIHERIASPNLWNGQQRDLLLPIPCSALLLPVVASAAEQCRNPPLGCLPRIRFRRPSAALESRRTRRNPRSLPAATKIAGAPSAFYKELGRLASSAALANSFLDCTRREPASRLHGNPAALPVNTASLTARASLPKFRPPISSKVGIAISAYPHSK